MASFFVIRPKHLRYMKLGVAALLISGAAWLWYEQEEDSVPTMGAAAASGQERTIHLVTGEFKATGPDGKTIEAYRWDPGTIYAKKGETIRLSIFGVNGASHPFIIDGLNVKGEVKKGQETVVTFKADKPGVYRIICMTHPDIAHNGPMIGYLIVDE
jgi:plastocyanin